MTIENVHADILVINDEIQIRRVLRTNLESNGYSMREAHTGLLGLAEIITREPDVVILDLGLPDISVIEVLQRLRESSRVPVLILSVRGTEEDAVAALDCGADDYLTKPFTTRELLARLRVLLGPAPPAELSIFSFGDVVVDFSSRVVTKGGREMKLGPKEYTLLRLLAVSRGKVLTHKQIICEIWGPSAEVRISHLRLYILKLRQKLEDEPNHPRFFRTELSIGYRLAFD